MEIIYLPLIANLNRSKKIASCGARFFLSKSMVCEKLGKKQAGAGEGQSEKPFGDCGKSKEGRKRWEGRARGKGWRQTFFGAGESRGRQARSGFVIENG